VKREREREKRDGRGSPKRFFCVVYLGFCLFRVLTKVVVGKEEESKETREERERERE